MAPLTTTKGFCVIICCFEEFLWYFCWGNKELKKIRPIYILFFTRPITYIMWHSSVTSAPLNCYFYLIYLTNYIYYIHFIYCIYIIYYLDFILLLYNVFKQEIYMYETTNSSTLCNTNKQTSSYSANNEICSIWKFIMYVFSPKIK